MIAWRRPVSALREHGGPLLGRDGPIVGGCYSPHMSNPAVQQALKTFVEERGWGRFHTPENLAKSISIEAAELLECFQWSPEYDPADVRGELADVVTYCMLLADRLGLELDDVVVEKLERTREKYPVEKSRGRSTKYDRL